MASPQSRQSAKLFLQSSELGDSPTPSPAGECASPGSGGRGTLAGERGVVRVPIPTRDIHFGTLNIYVLCGHHHLKETEASRDNIKDKSWEKLLGTYTLLT